MTSYDILTLWCVPECLWSLWSWLQSVTAWPLLPTPPSSGFLGIFLLLNHCDTVNVFEYIPSMRLTKRWVNSVGEYRHVVICIDYQPFQVFHYVAWVEYSIHDGWCSQCILNSEAKYWQQSHSGVTTTMTRTTSAALWATGILCRQRSWPLSASTLAPTSRCTGTATSPSRASPPVSQTGARAAVIVDRYSVQSYISLSAHRYNVYSISLLFFYIMEIYKQLSNNQIFIDI